MKIESIYDASFKPYGQILAGYDTKSLISAMNEIPLPETGVAYEPSITALEANAIFGQLQNNAYGGMPVQIGMCWGRNTKLNCLEYHRDSEVNIGTGDFILLLAKQDGIVNGKLDTAKIKAFRAPAGVAVEIYATTLHYAPCHTDEMEGFRVAIVLPKGTNEVKPAIAPVNEEDKRLWARNKWLLAHPESGEAGQGAYVGLVGENIDIGREGQDMEEKMIEVIPYLSFKGDCEDALHIYFQAFGGEILFLSRWSEENYETPEQIGKVMHVEFTLGGTRMSGGDSFDTGEVNTDIKLMIHVDTQTKALHTMSILAEGGTVAAPLQPHPAPDDDGCGSIIKDRFGFTWIITCPNSAKQ